MMPSYYSRLYFEEPDSDFEKVHGEMGSESPNRNGIIFQEPGGSPPECMFKVVVVGDYCVGKSSIVARFCDDFFREAHATTIGIDYKIKTIKMPDKRSVKLEIFDTAGLDKFRSVASNYYQNASGVMIVYDVTDENSFVNVEKYLQELKFFIPPDAEILLVGNKADLADQGERRVEFEEADQFASKMGLSIFEVSAKTGLNINASFVELSEKMREKVELGTFDKDSLETEDIFGETNQTNTNSFLGCIWCCV
jgi:small GTP-binding protein